MNKLYLILSTLVFITASFASHSSAQDQNQTPPTEQQILAVSTVRTINTAEAAYFYSANSGAKQSRNHYAPWPELFTSGLLQEMKQSAPDVWSHMNADGIQGYNLALIVSPDGKSYQLALHDANPQTAGFSVFTDQSGLIYTGSPLQ